MKFLNQTRRIESCAESHKQKHVLENEYKEWDTHLNFMISENSFLILKLTAALEGKKDGEYISKAEYFLNEFIMNDEFIIELKKDIKTHLQLIYNAKIDNVSSLIVHKHQKLKNEIMNFDKKFSTLETEFNEYTLRNPIASI